MSEKAENPRLPGRYFGTDGFRGEAGVTLTAEHAFRLGRFLGCYLGEGARREGGEGRRVRVVIGKDPRLSGYMLEYAVAAGLAASGADAYLLHVTTTPSVSFVTRSEGFDCGVMISASHNPFTDNGIKILNRAGEKMEDTALFTAEDYLDGVLDTGGADLPFARGQAIGKTVDYVEGRNRYLGYLLSLASFSLHGMRIGIDAANGSAWNLARAVFHALGATTTERGAAPNGKNINHSCGSTHPEGLARMVRERGLDVGFAFDGDADRCIAADERGQVIDGAALLYAVGGHMKREGSLRGGVVSTVMANSGLEAALAREGIPLLRTPVGDKHVYAAMMKNGWNLGGEPSGHIIFSRYATTGDGILTALEVLRVMRETGQPLSALVAPYVPLPEAQLSVAVRSPAAAAAGSALQAAVRETEETLAGRGRVLVRASGTEPVVRVLVEAEDEGICQRLARQLADVIREEGL